MNGTATQSQQEVIYEFARMVTLEGWWIWTLVIGCLAALLFASIRYYRRDVSELSTPIRWSLIVLRVTTILALVFFFLNLQRRTQRMFTRPSEVVVLVDTSQSMSLPADSQAAVDTRSDRVQKLLADSVLLDKLGAEHQVSIYAFGEQSEPRLIDSLDEIYHPREDGDDTPCYHDTATTQRRLTLPLIRHWKPSRSAAPPRVREASTSSSTSSLPYIAPTRFHLPCPPRPRFLRRHRR